MKYSNIVVVFSIFCPMAVAGFPGAVYEREAPGGDHIRVVQFSNGLAGDSFRIENVHADGKVQVVGVLQKPPGGGGFPASGFSVVDVRVEGNNCAAVYRDGDTIYATVVHSDSSGNILRSDGGRLCDVDGTCSAEISGDMEENRVMVTLSSFPKPDRKFSLGGNLHPEWREQGVSFQPFGDVSPFPTFVLPSQPTSMPASRPTTNDK